MSSTKQSKIGANDPCPCGSGKKFKKCCRDNAVGLIYTSNDRVSAFAKLDFFIDELMVDEEEEAYEEFWGRYLDGADELGPDLARLSNDAYDLWFAFDRIGDDGVAAVDLFLEQADLSHGERAFLTSLRRSTMRLYEVDDLVPGVSMTLRDVVEGGPVTVNEGSGSKSIDRYEWVAARVVPRGPSGGAEIEAGLLHIPPLVKEATLESVRRARRTFLREHPSASTADFYKTLPPLFHEVWAGSLLEPAVPHLHNTDGEEMIVTRVHFDVVDAGSLSEALDGHAEFELDGESTYRWIGNNSRGEPVLLGRIERREAILLIETNSVERSARGKSLLEGLAGEAIRHRATTHENLRRTVQEAAKARFLAGGQGEGEDGSSREPAIPPEAAEALVLGSYSKHYRAWMDEAVPALDGQTPRQASRDSKLRSRVIDLIHDLERGYRQALRAREPAYDPSWMWNELGLCEEPSAQHPPPLAHERVAARMSGSAEVSRSVAARLRGEPDFDEATSVFSRRAFDTDLEIQRWLRQGEGAASRPERQALQAADYLFLMLNFELHRKKTFWVDDSLAYMLAHTDVDGAGPELRVPFASFAIVFTDRHFLSMGERLLSRQDGCPLAGQLLRVATVYVTEERRTGERVIDLCFAFDALGADLPELVHRSIAVTDDASVRRHLEEVESKPVIEPVVADASPLRGLLRTAINSILYATSADVKSELRLALDKVTHRSGSNVSKLSSEEVYFLPGTIDITRVRKIQEIERAPQGGEMLRRYMVRGHWRRAQQNWTDRRLRWIEPYWKGPDMAAIVERAYRLKD
jgi:hypothetical protein